MRFVGWVFRTATKCQFSGTARIAGAEEFLGLFVENRVACALINRGMDVWTSQQYA
jgi:hypothetical protein